MAVCELNKSWGIIEDKCQTPTNIAEARYCRGHGCRICNYVNPKSSFSKSKKKIEVDLGEGKKEEVCSIDCKNKSERQKYEKADEEEQRKREEFVKRSDELYNETITEIKSIFAPFYEIIKEVRVNEARKYFLGKGGKVKPFQFHVMCCSSIEKDSSLKQIEKEEWKKECQKVVLLNDIVALCMWEKNNLPLLAKKYKEEEEKARQNNIPECKKCKLRKEQPNAWPAGCEGWCKECTETKQKQTPNNNDNYQPPINNSSPINSSPKDNQENFPHSQNNSTESASSQTDENNKVRERERERERESKPPTRPRRTSHHQRIWMKVN